MEFDIRYGVEVPLYAEHFAYERVLMELSITAFNWMELKAFCAYSSKEEGGRVFVGWDNQIGT